MKPTEFTSNQGKQFTGQLQRNRSKKKIGKRRVTPLYPDYHGQSNQLDEIFIILKEEDPEKEVLSSITGADQSTYVIYDSLSNLPRSTDINPISGLSFNLHNESAIDTSIESYPRLSIGSANEPNDNELNSIGESAHNSSHSSAGTSADKPNETEVVDKSILPVHQMVKHWTLTTNEFNDSHDSRNRSAAVDIPNCSSIRNKRAIFERASSVLDGDKENEPKRISHTYSGSSLSALRAKQLTVQPNDFSRWLPVDGSHAKLGDHPSNQQPSSNQTKDLPQQCSQSNRVKEKLKVLNQWTNGNELPNGNAINGNVINGNARNSEFRSQPIDRLKSDCRSVNRAKSDRPRNSPVKAFSSGNDQPNVNEQFNVNVKSVKSFWESLVSYRVLLI